MSLCERHPGDARLLAAEFAGDRQVRVESLDGYRALKALLPPRERRGLVLIDPAYELKDEHRRLLEAVREGYRRWGTGTFAIWYPIRERAEADDFLRRFRRLGMAKVLVAELSVTGGDCSRLGGSGMIVINPPWRLDEQLLAVLPWLGDKLAAPGQGGWRVEWLAEEARFRHPPSTRD